MSHPHAALLEEFRIVLDRLVPLAPAELVTEGRALHEQLTGDMQTTERQVHQAIAYIGTKEYPYRKAYQELCAKDEERRLETAIMARLDEGLAEKIRAITQHGVHVLDYAASPLFETQLAPEERYRVEEAILGAHEVINRQCDERARERHATFAELVERWSARQAETQALIEQLRALSERSATYASEIIERADRLTEGWSIAEHDPTPEGVRQEIVHWMDVLAQEDEGGEEEIFC